MKNAIFTYVLICKYLPNGHVGGETGISFLEIWPSIVFETCNFVKEKLEGPP